MSLAEQVNRGGGWEDDSIEVYLRLREGESGPSVCFSVSEGPETALTLREASELAGRR